MVTTDLPPSTNTSINGTADDGTPYWSIAWTIALSTSILVFMIVSIIGNILVLLVVVRHRGMRTRTNMFLCSLAATDMLTAILDMPVSFITVFKGRWIFGSWTGPFCQFNGFTMVFFFTTSIHTMMYISVHKYVSITRPFSRILTHRRILLMIGAAWLWAALTSFLTLYGLNHVLYKPYTTQCGPDYPHDLVTYMHPVYMSLSCYLIPFIVMTFCYTRVFQEIRAHSIRLERHTNQEKDVIFLQQRRITSTLLMVLVIFALSWTPYIVYSIYASILDDKSKIDHNVNALGYWCGYFSSAVNPIIYALRSPAFRDGYKEIMCQTKAIITSEETEQYETSSRLGRIRAFIRQSLRSTSSISNSSQYGPKPTMANLTNFILRSDHRRTLSTNSLPEGFRYCSMDGPKLTVIGGIPVITIGGKIVYYKDINERPKPKRYTYTPADDYVSEPDPNQIKEESAEDRMDSEDVSHNSIDDDYVALLNRENSMDLLKRKSQDINSRSPSIMEKDPLLTPGNSDGKYTQRRSIISSCDDSVFVLIEDVDVPTVTLQCTPPQVSPPRIEITDEGGRRTSDASAASPSRIFNRSLSENYPPEVVQQEDLPRSSSETSLKKAGKEHKGFLHKVLMNRLFRKDRKRQSLSEPSSSEPSSYSSGSPRHGYLRSVSEMPSTRKTSSSSMDPSIPIDGTLKVNNIILKASSDTMIAGDEKKKKGVYEKKKVDFDSVRKSRRSARIAKMFRTKLSSDDFTLRRAFSDKPRLRRAPSVEKLDKHRRASKSQDIEVGTYARKQKELREITNEKTTEVIEVKSSENFLSVKSRNLKKRSHDLGRPNRTSYLIRSISDPCLTFDKIEEMVVQRRETRKFRHRKSRRGTRPNISVNDKNGKVNGTLPLKGDIKRKKTPPSVFVFPECNVPPRSPRDPKARRHSEFPAPRHRHDTEESVDSEVVCPLATCESIPSLDESPLDDEPLGSPEVRIEICPPEEELETNV